MSEGLSLQEYVRETLLAIAGGVRDAQTDGDLGELIGRAPLTDLGSFARDLQGNTVTKVDFDVATTVEEKSSGGVGGSPNRLALAAPPLTPPRSPNRG